VRRCMGAASSTDCGPMKSLATFRSVGGSEWHKLVTNVSLGLE
jgi:hypothetical protein